MADEKRGCILVVDDIQMIIEMAVKQLESKFDVITAINGEEGFKVLKSKRELIDAVLLDIGLPEMDGFTFLKTMKESGLGNIPVIMMTADEDPRKEIQALKDGAADFIRKPLYAEILQNRIQNVLMRNQMEYDSLTGLYNRKKTFQMIQEMVKTHPGEQFAFMRFDIDNFSIYNSSMGEEEGNRLLKLGAMTLKNMAREKGACVFGRIDADVFCVCERFNEKLVRTRIQNTMECLRKYRSDYRIEASFGICVFSDSEVSIERIYTNASLAAHTCKGIYDKIYAYYEPWMSEQYAEEQEIVNEMVDALNGRQFVPFLQPKYDLDSDEPCGAEALVRWIHPIKGMISPGKFIPVFEKNGFISKLDYYMWEQVCSLLHRWKNAGKRIYPISVNVSRISMHNPRLVSVLLDLVDKYELTPELLQLEITESAYMTNPVLMKETIEDLQKNGFIILMDDFGSGYSSLNTLKEINVDILKVDMKFLPEGDTAARSEKILSSVIRMAGWLGIPTIAEGVETIQQRDFLKGIGCDYVQGFYYSKPMPVEEYERLVGKSKLVLDKRNMVDSLSSAWSSDGRISDILTAIQLPVAIIEHSSSRTEVVRVNLNYGELFGGNINDFLDERQQQHLKQIIVDADEDGEAEGEVVCSFASGRKKYCKVRVKLIEKSPAASLLCAIILDISAEKIYGSQLQRFEKLVPLNNRTKMLVVDDSSVSRKIVQSLFENDYDILEAENGQIALNILRKEKEDIAIILLDMKMPVMDGKEFLMEKNKLDETDIIPVIVMSADSDSQLDMLAMGVNDYITKPFDTSIFNQRVHNAIMYAERFVEIRKEYEHVIVEDEITTT